MLLKEFQEDRLLVKVYFDRSSMGQAAAREAGERLRSLLAEQPTVNMIFAAAPSQNEVLSGLIEEKGIDWSRVRAFHMDEYIGLSDGSSKSFANFLSAALFSKLPFGEVYLIGSNAEEACTRYAEILARFPPDIVCLGIGENGHIAFNDPHVADFHDNVLIKVVDLDDACRRQQVNDKTFDSFDEVPKYAVTLTIPALFQAKYMICTVPDEKKAWAVAQTVKAEVSECVPSTVLRRHEHAVLFTDKDSARDILTTSK